MAMRTAPVQQHTFQGQQELLAIWDLSRHNHNKYTAYIEGALPLLLEGAAEAAAASSLYTFCSSWFAPVECNPCAFSSCSISCPQTYVLLSGFLP